MVKHLGDCSQTGNVPNLMVESRTILAQKHAGKGNTIRSYRPIVWLNLLWKLLTGIINENVYDHLN